MSRSLDEFLDAHLPQPGVVAAAIRLPDRRVLSRRDGDALTTAQVEQALAHFALAAEGLRRQRLESRRLCWSFERARVQLARRGDGAVLVLFTERGNDRAEQEIVERLVAEFEAE